MEMIRVLQAAWRDHVLVRDAVLAGCLWLFTSSWSVATYPVDTTKGWWLVWSLAVCFVPLAWRRARPDAAAGVIAAGCLSQLILMDSPLPQNLAVPIVVYAVSAYGSPSLRPWWLGLALLGAVLATLDWAGPIVLDRERLQAQAVLAGAAAACCVAAYAMGSSTRQRHAVLASLRDRAQSLERERDSSARLAVQEERSRIAREMHDIVAHSLSVIVVQADGAGYAADHGDEASSRGMVRASLDTIAETARSALAETRALVGVLREPGELACYAPQATLEQIGELVDRARDSGVRVSLDVSGEAGEVPASTGAAVYRVVQEALTNAIRHAGPEASILVCLERTPDELHLSVRDDGRGPTGGDGQGHGLLGMRERVTSVGGTLDARERLGGGFEVLATLPTRTENR